MKKYLNVFLVLWILIWCFALIGNSDEYSIKNKIVIIFIIFISIALLFRRLIINYIMDKMNTKLRKEKEKKENDKINNLQSGLPIIDIPSIFLDNAQLHFYEPATLLTSENRMLGLINETYGTTTKIYRLFQNYTDKYNTQSIGKSQAVYGDVDLHYGGELAITEKSIIFMHQQKGFEIKLDHIALMQPFADGIGIQSEDKVYQLLIDEPRYFIAIVNYIKNII